MNIGEIAELFIRAAEVERALPEHVGPAPVRSLDLGYVHDWIDKLGWSKQRGDKLKEDPLEEERRIFWERVGLRASSYELSRLEKLREWLLVVPSEGERRALLAWAMSKVGGKKFSRWCFKVEGIHPETGRRRKDRALSRIQAHVSRRPMQHSENGEIRVLLPEPENADIEATFPEPSEQDRSPRSWLADDGFAPFLGEAIPGEFDWAEKRNARRRQREAAKRKRQDRMAA
jgi:hypothetical protein